jgi:uncharacterized Zn finger protein
MPKDRDPAWWRDSEAKGPREAKGGIKAHSRRGAFGRSWWARRWLDVLERLELGGRLTRGRSYARRGQVLDLRIEEGCVRATVQGSRADPYAVTIRVQPLSEAAWGRVGQALRRHARFAARLLASEMPEDVEEAFRGADASLFPARRDELATECSCPDWSNPCKHIAAVYYLVGEEFDRDPFLIFRLRGLSREKLVALLGSRSGGTAAAEEAPVPAPIEPLPSDAAAFWSGEGERPGLDEVRPPEATAAVLRRLGAFPFWRASAPLAKTLEPVYARASAAALDVFLGLRAPRS